MSLLQLMVGGKTVSQTPKVLFLTSGSIWTVPNDWNNFLAGPAGYINKIEVIGGGGGGGGGDVNGGGGGGGGAYSAITNLTSLTIGSSVSYNAGLAGNNGAGGSGGANGGSGGDSWFNGTSVSAASVSAKGGSGGKSNNNKTGGSGGSAASGIGTTKYSGGTGGTGNDTWGGSGGGAAGPGGNGGNGAVGNPSSTPGGAGASGSWTSYPGGTTISPGDGGLAGVSGGVGRPGVVYGGGGGGGDDDGDKAGGDGAQGVIVITYYPLIEPNPPLESFSFVASATAQNSNSLTIPATAQAGDIAILVDCVNTVAANITLPSGWVQISADFVGSGIGVLNAHRVLSSSDPGSTFTSTNSSTTDHNMILAVFRPTNISSGGTSSITSATVGSSSIEAATGGISEQDVKLSETSSSQPVIALYSMSQRGSENVSLNINETPTNDGSVTNTIGGYDKMKLYYKIYSIGTARSDIGETDYLNDAGSQCLATWYITFT